MARDITDSSFEQEVLESEMPVMVDFWAPWCGPCRLLTPTIEELSKELADRIKIVKINIDDNPRTPSEFGVRSIPTMILFENGKKIDSKAGVSSKDDIKKWLNSSVKI